MPQYLIESPHTKEECLKALDEIVDEKPDMLDKFSFGCKAGEHVGYVTVDASDKSEALNMLPSDLRGKAHVVELSKFSREDIQSFHSM